MNKHTFFYAQQQQKNTFNYNLFFGGLGVLLILLHVLGVTPNGDVFFAVGVSQLIVSAIGFLIYAYIQKCPFIVLDNTILQKGIVFKQKIAINQLIDVYLFANELVLKTASTEMRIDKDLLNNEDFEQLHELVQHHSKAINA